MRNLIGLISSCFSLKTGVNTRHSRMLVGVCCRKMLSSVFALGLRDYIGRSSVVGCININFGGKCSKCDMMYNMKTCSRSAHNVYNYTGM